MHKAVHLRTATIVAVKIVPIENDLEDIVREVNVMSGLDSDYVVRLYGSYLKLANLWVRAARVAVATARVPRCRGGQLNRTGPVTACAGGGSRSPRW